MSSDRLNNILIRELTEETENIVSDFANYIVQKLSNRPLGVLYYGSVLRKNDYNGILDFYIITDKVDNFSKSLMGRLGNRVLPPNVYYLEKEYDTVTLRAKVAVLSLSQFLQRSTLDSRDTTIWARFCQPVRLVWVRDSSAADSILDGIRRCVITASCWAALLGPHSGSAEEYWHALFARTYKAELRVEKKNRSRSLLEKREERYTAILLASWEQASLRADHSHGTLQPHLSQSVRTKAERNWKKIENKGKFLNVMRLFKAAFTFSDGLSYLLWKIERHSGKKITVSSFEKKHPLLTLPLILWRLRDMRTLLKR